MKKQLLLALAFTMLLSNMTTFSKTVTLFLNDGRRIKGEVLDSTGNMINFKLGNGIKKNYPKNEILKILEPSIAKIGSVGVGIGVPYGVLGLNGEVNLIPNLSVSGGLGWSATDAGMGYSIGARVYLMPIESNFRVRASLHYGLTTVLVNYIENVNEYYDYYHYSYQISHKVNEKYDGISTGLGAQWMFGSTKRVGLDFDILYNYSPKWEARKSELKSKGFTVPDDPTGNIKVNLGFRIGF